MLFYSFHSKLVVAIRIKAWINKRRRNVLKFNFNILITTSFYCFTQCFSLPHLSTLTGKGRRKLERSGIISQERRCFKFLIIFFHKLNRSREETKWNDLLANSLQETFLKCFNKVHTKQIAGSEHSVHHESDKMKKMVDYVLLTIQRNKRFSNNFFFCGTTCFAISSYSF